MVEESHRVIREKIHMLIAELLWQKVAEKKNYKGSKSI